MATGHQKDEAMIRSLAFSAPASNQSPDTEERLEMELMTDHDYAR